MFSSDLFVVSVHESNGLWHYMERECYAYVRRAPGCDRAGLGSGCRAEHADRWSYKVKFTTCLKTENQIVSKFLKFCYVGFWSFECLLKVFFRLSFEVLFWVFEVLFWVFEWFWGLNFECLLKVFACFEFLKYCIECLKFKFWMILKFEFWSFVLRVCFLKSWVILKFCFECLLKVFVCVLKFCF